MRIACALALAVTAVACHSSGSTTTPAGGAGAAAGPQLVAQAVVGAFTADDRAVYWVDDHVLWRRALDDPMPRRIGATTGEVQALIRHGDRLYAITFDGIVAVPIAGGDATSRPITIGEPGDRDGDDGGDGDGDGGSLGALAASAAADDGMVLGLRDRLVLVPWDGAEVRTIADRLQVITAVAADAEAYYVAALSEAVHAPRGDNLPPQTIWRIARRGGERTRMADGEYMVRGLDVRGGRLTWSTEDGGGVKSIAIARAIADRATLHHDLTGRVIGFAAAPRGAIAQVASGLIADVGASPPRLFTIPEGTQTIPYDPIAAAGDGIVVRLTDAAERPGLWWLPRPGPDAPAVIAWPRLQVTRLAADGDDLYFLDSPLEPRADRPARIVRVPGHGPSRTIARAPMIDTMAVAGGAVVYAAGGALHLIDDRGDRRLCDAGQAIALTLGVRAVYWIEGGVVRTVSRDGGVPTSFHQPDFGGGGTGAPFAEMVVDGTSLYYSSLGWGAAGVFHTRGGAAAETLFTATDDDGLGDSLTTIAGDLYLVLGASRIERVPMNGATPSEAFGGIDGVAFDRLIGGGGRLYATASDSDRFMVVAIDPSGPTTQRAQIVARFPGGEQSQMIAAGDHAVYVAPAETRWIIRYGASGRSAAHDVSAQRPPNTPPTSSPGRLSR